VRGDEYLRYPRGGNEIEIFRDTREVTFRRHDQLSLAPAAGDPENTVAYLPGGGGSA